MRRVHQQLITAMFVQELARLLGGDKITEAVITNAQEMRKMAEETKRG